MCSVPNQKSENEKNYSRDSNHYQESSSSEFGDDDAEDDDDDNDDYYSDGDGNNEYGRRRITRLNYDKHLKNRKQIRDDLNRLDLDIEYLKRKKNLTDVERRLLNKLKYQDMETQTDPIVFFIVFIFLS